MKRNLIARTFLAVICVVLIFGMIPTGALNKVMPSLAPDIASEVEAVAGTKDRIMGLFYVRDNGNKNLYMTNSNWYLTQSTFEAKKSGDNLLSQMWLFVVGTDGYTYIRSLSDIMANQGGTYGNRWLSWDHGWNTTTFPTCKNIDGTVSAEPGNPTSQGTYRWQTTTISANSDGSYNCYIKESAAAYYIQNVSGKVQTGRALGNTSGTYLYLEPCYDPMFENARPLQFNNQPTGTTSYKLNNSSGTTVGMTTGNTLNNTWAVAKANNGYWYIINRSTGNYLTASSSLGGSATTKAVSGNPSNDATIQWQIVRQRYTTFTTYIIFNKGTGTVLHSNGSAATTNAYNFGANMNTYWTLGYSADFGTDVPEAPQFYGWASNTVRYFPASFSSQAGYVALRANSAKSIDGDKEGYLFDTATLASYSATSLGLSSNSTNHFWYNSGYAGFAEYPDSHGLGTSRVQFSFTQTSGQFIWIIGHGTQVTAKVNGTTYTVTDGITKITPGTSGTGTVDITASGHFGIFTNVSPAAQSGTPTLALSGTNNQVIHGDTNYTVTLSNKSNYPITNVAFTISISGGHSVTITAGTNSSTNTDVVASSGGATTIAAGGTATWTITMKPGGMTADTNYTITVNAATYYGYNSADAAPNASNSITKPSNTISLKECNSGKVTASVATSPNGGVVNGEVTYTISIKNGCNHTVNDINFTFGNNSVTILKVVNGAQDSKHAQATVSGLATSIDANSTLTITVKVNYSSGFTAGTAYQYAVSSGTAANCAYTSLTYSTGNTTAVTTVNGGVTVAIKSSVSDKSIVKGNVVYTITFTNGTNHSVNNVDLVLKAGSTSLLTITDGAFTKGTGVTTDVESIGTIAAGGTATVKVTVDTTKLSTKTGYTVASSGGACTATGLAVGSRSLTISTGNVQTITTAGGSVTISSDSNIDSGKIVEGTYTYTVTVTNGTNHAINGVDFVVKNGSTTIVTVTDMGVTKTGDYVTISTSSLGTSIAAGGTATLTVTIDTTKLGDGSSHTFTVGNLSSNATGIAGTNSTYELTAASSYSHSITVRSGGVTMTWAPSITSGSVVEGTYYYDITFTNNTNHAITGIDYTVKFGSTTVVTVSNGAVTANQGYASVNKDSLGNLASGASVTLRVTIDTTKLGDKTSHTVTLASGSSNATGIAGSNASIELKPSTNSYSHNIIVRGGDIVVNISGDNVINGGVGVGNEGFTITVTNDANHAVKDMTITLKDSAGNTLLTIGKDGTVSVNDSTLVKNATVTGYSSTLASGGTLTISGILINAEATKLDANGRLILVASGSSVATGITGSNSSIALSDSSTNYTMMVRHDVNLMLQTGKQTTITPAKIFAAMEKSGAYATEKGLGLTANSITGIAITDKNGNGASSSGMSVSGSNLVMTLSAEYTEYYIKVTYSGGTVIVPMQAVTYNAGNGKVFVLDYGLPTTFTSAAILDGSRLASNKLTTTYSTVGFAAAYGNTSATTQKGNDNMGTYTLDGTDLIYTPDVFMRTTDSTFVVVRVQQNAGGTENVDYVNIYKSMSIVPANVVYYEDTFAGINYGSLGFEVEELGSPSTNGVTGSQTTPPEAGNSSDRLGYDDGSYANAKDVTLSGLSCRKVTVNSQAVTVRFSFTGTGFELISRCNAQDSATIVIKYRRQGDSSWTHYPVITQFAANGNSSTEVYQVPVFRIENGNYGNYEVEIMGLPKYADYTEDGTGIGGIVTTYLYLDGIRIYNPLGSTDATAYYGKEQGAVFANLRDLVLGGNAALTTVTGDAVTGFVTGDHYYVATKDKWYVSETGDIAALQAIGANNEIMVRSSLLSGGKYVIVLEVKASGNDSFLQFGLHDIHDGMFDGSGSNVASTVKYATTSGWQTLKANMTSGTEQYYEVDLNACPDGSSGYKLVALRVDSGFVSFTNIKYKGLTFKTAYPACDGMSVNFGSNSVTLVDSGIATTISDDTMFSLNALNNYLGGSTNNSGTSSKKPVIEEI